MSARVSECVRLGGWIVGGHKPPFPPGEAPKGPHVEGECKICGEYEFQLSQERDELAARRATQEKP